MKLITIVSGCYNEEENVGALAERIGKVFQELPNYRYELIFIDNASTDKTVEKIRELAAGNRCIKAIVNMRNFGHIRSAYHAFIQARGDAVILMATDLQDPPELIPDLIKHWEAGEKVVAAVKTKSRENVIMRALRTIYYKTLNAMANVELIEHFTGFGLYDQAVLIELRKVNDRYPYLRGLISEFGFRAALVPFTQPKRLHGQSHTNWYALYDMAMLGLTTHSVVPMRLATIIGFMLSIISLLVALFYFVYKLLYWQRFEMGTAPIVIGMFGMFSIQLMFIGLLGEYIGSSHRQLLGRPLVVEKERINFEDHAHSNQQPEGANKQIEMQPDG